MITQNLTSKQDYNTYIKYLEELDWKRTHRIITEKDTNLVTLYSYSKYNGMVINLRCPSGKKITIMGTKQVPEGLSSATAYPLKTRLADKDNKELSYSTKLKLVRFSVSDVLPLKRITYNDVRMDLDFYKQYRFDKGININGEESLTFHIVEDIAENNKLPNIKIDEKHIKFSLEADIWDN